MILPQLTVKSKVVPGSNTLSPFFPKTGFLKYYKPTSVLNPTLSNSVETLELKVQTLALV